MKSFEKRCEIVTGESIELSAVANDGGAELAFAESTDLIKRHVFDHVSQPRAAGPFIACADFVPDQAGHDRQRVLFNQNYA